MEEVMENIWVAVIGFFKDIIVACIHLLKKDRSDKKKEKDIRYDVSEEKKENPFIPSDAKIENNSLDDPDYASTIAIYLGEDRNINEIIVTDKKREK